MSGPETNWAGNVAYGAARVHRPTSLDQLRRIVASSDRVRALGTRHSFNRVADTTGDLVDVTALPFTAEIDAAEGLVRVSGGATYGRLAAYLHDHGLALHNLGSLPHISVAGACATATHGSGDRNGNLATAVSALEIVTATGDLVAISRDTTAEALSGAVVSLGGLGVVTSVTLDVEPTYDVQQHVYENLPAGALDDHLDEIFSSAYSVSLFTDWRADVFTQAWLKLRVDETRERPGATWFGATRADRPRHPIGGMPATFCTEQGGIAGPWHQRLPHFRFEFTPSAGEELQSEFLVSRHHATSALATVASLREHISPVLQVCEIRTVAADDLWLSPSYHRDSVGIHFTWVKDTEAVIPVLSLLEQHLAAYDATPHWGKLFVATPEVVRSRYPRAADFQALRASYDPSGKFGNDLVDACFPPPDTARAGPSSGRDRPDGSGTGR